MAFFVKAFINLFSGSSNEVKTSKAEEKPLLPVLEQGKKQLEAIKKDASNFADQIDDNISKAVANIRGIRGRGRGAVKSKAPPISSKVKSKGKDKRDSSPPPHTIEHEIAELIVENEDIVNGLGETPASSSAPRASLAAASAAAAATPAISDSSAAIETISHNSDQIGLKLEICELRAEIAYNTVERAVFDHFIKVFHDTRVSDDEYRIQCVDGVVLELQHMLTACSVHEVEASSMANITMRKVVESWLPDLHKPHPVSKGVTEESKIVSLVNTENEIFFKRMAAYLKAQELSIVFKSPKWKNDYKLDETRRLIGLSSPPPPPPPPPPGPPPPPPPGPPPPPPGPPGPPGNYYPTVSVGPFRYAIGPIVDFEYLEGRTLIYIKCYDDNTYTTGIYFWVYLSQSEGMFRVFFKLLANSIIEKGFDYTQATLICWVLQAHVNLYYNTHYKRGKQNPIKIDSLRRVIYFVENMSYLQSNFLDNFPLPVIVPCPNPVPHCCYVGIPLPPHLFDASNRPQRLGGHYYFISKKYNSIFSHGFPITPEGASNIPNLEADPYYMELMDTIDAAGIPLYQLKFKDLLRDPPVDPRAYHDRTYPLIYSFTTSCHKSFITSFKEFLDVGNYSNTFWVQGLQNFTKRFNGVLSPVLYITIGAMINNPDFKLSSFRYEMLNVNPTKVYSDVFERTAEYKRADRAITTLGTENAPDASIFLPGDDPKPRTRALAAHDKMLLYEEYERRTIPTIGENLEAQRAGIRDMVNMVISQVCNNRSIDILLQQYSLTWMPIWLLNKLLCERPTDPRVSQLLTIRPDLAGLHTLQPCNDRPIDVDHEFIQKLQDFAILSLKKRWLEGMLNFSYESLNNIFSREDTINNPGGIGHGQQTKTLYYLNIDGFFHPLPDLKCKDPSDPALLTLPSEFTEKRKENFNIRASPELDCKILTLAQIYCMEFKYLKYPPNPPELKTMCVFFQVSSTIVYKETPGNLLTPASKQIVFAIDMQKTPIACIPEFDIQRRPDVMDLGGGTRSRSRSQSRRGEGASKQHSRSSSPRGSRREGSPQRRSPSPRGRERGERDERYKQEQKERQKIWELFLYSQYTICGTYKRVSSWGGFFSGKMMEYLFGQYFQLPTFFKYFANILQVCHQYCTTAPIYNYNNASPYCFLEIPAHFSFIDRFVHHFGAADVASFSGSIPYLPPIVHADGRRDLQVLADRPYIQTWLTLHTLQIRICSELFMAPFMDADIDDAESFSEHASSLSSRSSLSSSESWVSDIKANAGSYPYPALTWLTLGPLEESVEGDGSFRSAMSSNGSRGSRGSRDMGVGAAPEGGGGKMKHLLPVSYTKKNRKIKYINKNNNNKNKNKTHHNKKYSLTRHRFKKNKTGKTNRTNKTFRKKYRH